MHTTYTTERGPDMCVPNVVKLKKTSQSKPKRNKRYTFGPLIYFLNLSCSF